MFSCEIWETFDRSIFYRTYPVVASGKLLLRSDLKLANFARAVNLLPAPLPQLNLFTCIFQGF